jgi:hypothetical protein
VALKMKETYLELYAVLVLAVWHVKALVVVGLELAS